MCRPFNFYQTKKIKTRYGAIKLHLFKQFQSNLLPQAPDARLFNLCKKAAFTACNFTTSSHSSQYDFSMHGLILGPFNFHERKENQNTRYNAFEPYLFIQFQSKPAFNACKLHYFITL